MPSSEMLRRVALANIDVLEELGAYTIRVKWIGELGTLAVTLMMVALSSSETSVLATARRRKIREDNILHSHRRNNLKSYKKVVV
jgi:hypothetical protein